MIKTTKSIFVIFILLVIANSCAKKDEVVNYDLVTSVQPEEGGIVTPDSGDFPSSTNINITATANEGFIFKNWSGASIATSSSITLRVDSDKRLTAIFEKLDSDGDGVFDDADQCDNTPAEVSVDANGCSDEQKDTDSDGVTDAADNCAETPAGEAVDDDGCANSQKDTDGDGVTDDLDQCENTPQGEIANTEGCSSTQSDADADGVNDAIDECENTPSGESVNEQGCSTSQIDNDGDGVNDDKDQCADTVSGEFVDENGCSPSQLDTDAPIVTDFIVTEITSNSFTVDWNLNEDSKGYIQFGTIPGEYSESTGVENSLLDRHLQTVGGIKPLDSNTTYYWRIYVEDQYGNTDFSEEQSTTTLAEVLKTYVPDDQFESTLIFLGYDDVMDDYVLTANIENVLTLTLGGKFNYDEIINDFTGLQDFKSLQNLTIQGQNTLTSNNIDLSSNLNLMELYFHCTSIDGVDLSKNVLLEVLKIRGGDIGEACRATVSNLDLSFNTNLKILWMNLVNSFDDLNLLVSKASSIEELILGQTPGHTELSLVNNINLRKVYLFGDAMSLAL